MTIVETADQMLILLEKSAFAQQHPDPIDVVFSGLTPGQRNRIKEAARSSSGDSRPFDRVRDAGRDDGTPGRNKPSANAGSEQSTSVLRDNPGRTDNAASVRPDPYGRGGLKPSPTVSEVGRGPIPFASATSAAAVRPGVSLPPPDERMANAVGLNTGTKPPKTMKTYTPIERVKAEARIKQPAPVDYSLLHYLAPLLAAGGLGGIGAMAGGPRGAGIGAMTGLGGVGGAYLGHHLAGSMGVNPLLGAAGGAAVGGLGAYALGDKLLAKKKKKPVDEEE